MKKPIFPLSLLLPLFLAYVAFADRAEANYCQNDPVNNVDVLGLQAVAVTSQDMADNLRSKWLLELIVSGLQHPGAPTANQTRTYADYFGLTKPFAAADYERAASLAGGLIVNYGRPSTRAAGDGEVASNEPTMSPGLTLPEESVHALTTALGGPYSTDLAQFNGGLLLPMGASGFVLNGTLKGAQISRLLATGMSLERSVLLTEINAELRTGLMSGAKTPSELYWHGSAAGVARRNLTGIFVDGPGNGGLFWATSKEMDELGPLAWRVGGNTNVQLIPPKLINKGGLEATYNLTSAESAMFRRAWGPTFNWNPYQWWKGAAGQYYYRPAPAGLGTRLGEAGKAAAITGAWTGVPYIYYKLNE